MIEEIGWFLVKVGVASAFGLLGGLLANAVIGTYYEVRWRLEDRAIKKWERETKKLLEIPTEN